MLYISWCFFHLGNFFCDLSHWEWELSLSELPMEWELSCTGDFDVHPQVLLVFLSWLRLG